MVSTFPTTVLGEGFCQRVSKPWGYELLTTPPDLPYAGKTYRYPQVQEPYPAISNPTGEANGTAKRTPSIRVPEPAAFLD